MRNKYNYNELVKVSGEGKIFGNIKNKLGFIIKKDEFFEDYYIDLIFSKKDWFNEESIERVFKKNKNKTEKYQVRLCTTRQGYNFLKEKIKENEPISNNKFKKIDIYRKFEKNNKTYIIIGWKSVCWPKSNNSIKILEKTLHEFKIMDIPYQYVVLNEDRIEDIRLTEFTDNDINVKVFSIERKIKTKTNTTN